MESKKTDIVRLLKIFIPLIIGIIIAVIPPLSEELTVESMRFMGIFLCMIIWMIFDVFPDFVITLSGLTVMVALKVTDFGTAFSPFAGASVWLVIGAFGLSAAVAKTGLLKRLSFMILKLFPESFRGQVLALYTAGFVISPLIPSLNAKAAILAPFSAQISESLGYEKDSKGARGLFGAVTIITTIIGMAFVSGAVPVATIIGMMPEAAGAEQTWFRWFEGTWLWMVVILVLSFIAIMVLYNPKGSAEAAEKGLAKKQLEAMGPISGQEKIAAVVLVFALVGWMTAKFTGLNTTVVAMIALLVLFITGVMKGPDFKNQIAWTAVVFIGTIYSLASLLSKMGWSTYLAGVLKPILAPVAGNIWILIPVICVVVYIMRIFIMSQTAAITIIWAVFGGITAEFGVHPFPVLFTGYVATLVWHYAGNNTTTTTCLAATNDKMVTFKGTFQMNIVYMIITVIACMASIPVWKLMGYC